MAASCQFGPARRTGRHRVERSKNRAKGEASPVGRFRLGRFPGQPWDDIGHTNDHGLINIMLTRK